jgi:transposase-like protein
LLKDGTTGDLQAELIQLGVRRLVEEALAAEASEALGRGYYQRESERRAAGYRNGYRRGRMRTAAGAIEYAAPQVSDRAEPFRSRLRAQLNRRSGTLEQLALEMYARGLSTRDIEAAFSDEDGNSLLSKSAVSELTKRLWTEYEAFVTRELSEYELLNCYFDGIAERLRPGLPREAVLCAWGRARALW